MIDISRAGTGNADFRLKPKILRNTMRLKLLGALVFVLLTASLIVGTVFAASSTHPYTGPVV